MNVKKSVSIVENTAKKIGKGPLYWQNEQGVWISDTYVIYHLGAVLMIPEHWRERDMSDFINDSAAGVVEAEMTNVMLQHDISLTNTVLKNSTVRLFRYGWDFQWFNQLYLEPFKGDVVRYLIKDKFLLATDRRDQLRMIAMPVLVGADALVDLECFAKKDE
jgi:hypothetical protein